MRDDAATPLRPDAELAGALIRRLADEIGARRPCSPAERRAAELLAAELEAQGVRAELEPFCGYATFAIPYGLIAASALAAGSLPRSWGLRRLAIGALAAGGLIAEGSLTHTPLSRLSSRRASQNVVATIEPAGEARRTVCLMAHADSSRSGLLFCPRLQPYLGRWIAAQSVATLVAAAAPALERFALGRGALRIARAVVATGLGLLAERELRGVDVPGANDNASGAAAVVALAAAVAARPLASTRVVALVCGCEEAGLLGAQAFLRAHDTRGWMFMNLDGVGAPATLRYLPEEGLVRKWPADPALLAVAERIAAERPELGLERADAPLGLTYDATAVLAAGGRALTLVAGDRGTIPNYHQPSDTAENLDFDALGRALETAGEMLARIDRGDADP